MNKVTQSLFSCAFIHANYHVPKRQHRPILGGALLCVVRVLQNSSLIFFEPEEQSLPLHDLTGTDTALGRPWL